MMLIVSPSAASTMIEQKIDSGIDTAMISVLRQLPRKIRIMAPVRQAAIIASRTTPLIAALTKIDWSEIGRIFSAGGSCAAISGSCAAHAGDDVQRGGVARLQDGHQRGALAVDAHDVGLRRKAVAHIADVVDVDRRAVHES